MNIKWPPEETVEYKAEKLTRESGIVISALEGGNPKKARDNRDDEGR